MAAQQSFIATIPKSISEWCVFEAGKGACHAVCPNPPITGPATIMVFTISTLLSLVVIISWTSESIYNLAFQLLSTDGVLITLVVGLTTPQGISSFHSLFCTLLISSCIPIVITASLSEIGPLLGESKTAELARGERYGWIAGHGDLLPMPKGLDPDKPIKSFAEEIKSHQPRAHPHFSKKNIRWLPELYGSRSTETNTARPDLEQHDSHNTARPDLEQHDSHRSRHHHGAAKHVHSTKATHPTGEFDWALSKSTHERRAQPDSYEKPRIHRVQSKGSLKIKRERNRLQKKPRKSPATNAQRVLATSNAARAKGKEVLWEFRYPVDISKLPRWGLPIVVHWVYTVHLFVWIVIFGWTYIWPHDFSQPSCDTAFKMNWYRRSVTFTGFAFLLIAVIFWVTMGVGMRVVDEFRTPEGLRAPTYEGSLEFISRCIHVNLIKSGHTKTWTRRSIGVTAWLCWAANFGWIWFRARDEFLLLGDDPFDFGQAAALVGMVTPLIVAARAIFENFSTSEARKSALRQSVLQRIELAELEKEEGEAYNRNEFTLSKGKHAELEREVTAARAATDHSRYRPNHVPLPQHFIASSIT